MLMASDNMLFTVQASAMMSMHYIYVRSTKFKKLFAQLITLIGTLSAKIIWLHFKHQSSQILGPMMGLNKKKKKKKLREI